MNNTNIRVAFPYGLFHSFADLPLNNVFPCSALFDDKLIGGLFLTCTSSDLKFFDIVPPNSPQPDFKFRMLNINQEIYMVEFQLLFSANKILKLQLDPRHINVKMLFELLIDKKHISFHFYNHSTSALSSVYTDLDDDHLDWLNRNLKLIAGLKNNFDYQLLAHSQIDKKDKLARYYKFNGSLNIDDSFVGINHILAMPLIK